MKTWIIIMLMLSIMLSSASIYAKGQKTSSDRTQHYYLLVIDEETYVECD